MRGGAAGGREGAKLANVYPTTLAKHFENGQQRRGSFVLAVLPAFGLLSSDIAAQTFEMQPQVRRPPEGSLRDSAAYSIDAGAATCATLRHGD